MGLSGNLCLYSDVWDLGWENRGGVWQGEQLGSVRLKSLRGIFTHEFGGWCRLSAGTSAGLSASTPTWGLCVWTNLSFQTARQLFQEQVSTGDQGGSACHF